MYAPVVARLISSPPMSTFQLFVRFVIETMLEEVKVGVEDRYEAEQKAIFNLCKAQGKVKQI